MKSTIGTIFNIITYLMVYFFFQAGYIILTAVYYNMTSPGLSPEQTEQMLNDALPMAIIVATIISFFIYSAFIRLKKKQSIFSFCRFRPLSADKVIVLTFSGMGLLSLSAVVLGLVSFIFPTAYDMHVENMLGLTGAGGLIMVISVGFAAPFIEEIIFRGLIFNELNKKIPIALIIFLQALFFGIYHMNIVQGIYTFILALFMGVALYWTGSIWAPIILHVVNNLASTVLSLYVPQALLEKYSLVFAAYIVLSISFVLPITFRYLYRHRIEFDEEEDVISYQEDYTEL